MPITVRTLKVYNHIVPVPKQAYAPMYLKNTPLLSRSKSVGHRVSAFLSFVTFDHGIHTLQFGWVQIV